MRKGADGGEAGFNGDCAEGGREVESFVSGEEEVLLNESVFVGGEVGFGVFGSEAGGAERGGGAEDGGGGGGFLFFAAALEPGGGRMVAGENSGKKNGCWYAGAWDRWGVFFF